MKRFRSESSEERFIRDERALQPSDNEALGKDDDEFERHE